MSKSNIVSQVQITSEEIIENILSHPKFTNMKFFVDFSNSKDSVIEASNVIQNVLSINPSVNIQEEANEMGRKNISVFTGVNVQTVIHQIIPEHFQHAIFLCNSLDSVTTLLGRKIANCVFIFPKNMRKEIMNIFTQKVPVTFTVKGKIYVQV